MAAGGGSFNPASDYDFTGTVTVSGALAVTGTATSGGATIVTTSGTQTLTNKTLTSPTVATPAITGGTLASSTLTAPVLTAPASTSTGVVITKSGVLTELTGDGAYAITVPIPAGAFIHSIKVTNQALWTAGTSAVLKVGDTADDDGYFLNGDMKATDLVVGEVLDTAAADNWGGLEGAYLVAATGRRGPAATNFGTYYAAGSNIIFTITKSGAGTAGRTAVSVTYSVGETIAQVVT